MHKTKVYRWIRIILLSGVFSFIFIFCLIIISNMAWHGTYTVNTYQGDLARAKKIEIALRVYISDTDDKRLSNFNAAALSGTFEIPNNKPIDVETILIGLQKQLKLKNSQGEVRFYGPYLPSDSKKIETESFYPKSLMYDGWRAKIYENKRKYNGYTITIHTESQHVQVTPSDTGNAVLFIE